MPYFSRLTDIVTCSLTSLLAAADDPRTALEGIISEMQEGVAGAERSVRTACNNVARIESEIGEQRSEIASWVKQAQANLQSGDEEAARQSLLRKHEVEDLIAGLEQQLNAAIATRDHLQTMSNALVARLADARRRRETLNEEVNEFATVRPALKPSSPPVRQSRIDAELEELKRRLQDG